jgi:hypothetical protein
MELNGVADLCDGPCHHQRVKPTTAGGVAILLEFFLAIRDHGVLASSHQSLLL